MFSINIKRKNYNEKHVYRYKYFLDLYRFPVEDIKMMKQLPNLLNKNIKLFVSTQIVN
jgi:hypothetical protein